MGNVLQMREADTRKSVFKMQKGKRWRVKNRQVVGLNDTMAQFGAKIRRLNLPFKCDLNPLRQMGPK